MLAWLAPASTGRGGFGLLRDGLLGFRLEAAELAALDKASALPPEYPSSMQARLPGYRR